MKKEEIIEKIKTTTGCAAGNLGKYFYKNIEDLKKVIELTNFLPDDATLIIRFYYIRNDLTEIKKCKYCNKDILMNVFCCPSCNIKWNYENTDMGERIIKSVKESNLKNYGVSCVFQIPEINKKIKNTLLEKTGYDHNFKDPKVKEKRKQTWLNNLGVDNPNKSPIVIKRIQETNLERYKCVCPLQGKEQRKKKKETWMTNLGVDNPGKSKKCQQKAKDTYFEKTGYETPMRNPSVVNKVRNTFFENEGKGKHNKGYRYKIYTFLSGRQILIQGYEYGALDNYLLDIYNENEIENNIKIINEFKFEYGLTESGLKRKYIPDFYIKKDNLFIEVKSLYFYNKNLEGIYLKAKSVIEKGYNFYVLVSNDNKKFKKITYEEIETNFKNRS